MPDVEVRRTRRNNEATDPSKLNSYALIACRASLCFNVGFLLLLDCLARLGCKRLPQVIIEVDVVHINVYITTTKRAR